MRTVLIVEDEKKILKRLLFWIEEAELEVQVLTASTFEAGKDLIINVPIDLPVIDINLTAKDDELGVELAEIYREKYRYNPIIFQTVNEDYKYQSEIHKRIGSVFYLAKTELTEKSFVDAVRYELERLDKPFTKIIMIKLKDQVIRLDANQVIYFEKVNRERSVKCFYYDPEIGEVKMILLSNMTLKEIENMQNADVLLRCSGSHIVNPKMIKLGIITGNGVDLELKYTDERIPLGRSYYVKLRPILEGILK